MIALALLLCVAGFAALALAMERHRPVLMARPPNRRVRIALRVGGALALALAALACFEAWGTAQGAVGWFGALSAGAAVVLLALRYAPSRRPHSSSKKSDS